MNVFAKRTARKQSGAALIAFLLVFVTAASFALLKGLNEVATKQHRDAQTVQVLAEAKAALIGYAAGADIVPNGNCGLVSNCPRPGDLPCPDRDNNGYAGIGLPPSLGGPPPTCGSAVVISNQASRIGRLPWKTLGLPDLRDGSGERLWYAVSDNFKMNIRKRCDSSGSPRCLNSDSRGSITVRNSDGTVRHNGMNTSAAIAVIIAPGAVLQRQGSVAPQNRACTNCNGQGQCQSSPPTGVPVCNAINYLDRRASPTPLEDNQNFGDNNPTNGFIEGDVFDNQGNLIVNDKFAVITSDDMMPVLEKRVVGEVSNCFEAYAVRPANLNRYPWAAPVQPVGYDDATNTRFGRIPDGLPSSGITWSPSPGPNEQFSTTRTDSGNVMENSWPLGTCLMVSSQSKNTWWINWKESVFYGVGNTFRPGNAIADPTACATPLECLTLAPEITQDTRFVVIAAGRLLPGQSHASGQKGIPTNYLEEGNATFTPTDQTFVSGPVTPTFNDVTCKNGACL